MKELNMKPEEIANLVVLSREKGYAIVIPQDSLYLVSKALKERGEQIAALTAENAAMKKFINEDCWCMFPEKDGAYKASQFMPAIPATDAAANALRAEGVERYIESVLNSNMKVAEGGGYVGAVKVFRHLAEESQYFANQLREGK